MGSPIKPPQPLKPTRQCSMEGLKGSISPQLNRESVSQKKKSKITPKKKKISYKILASEANLFHENPAKHVSNAANYAK